MKDIAILIPCYNEEATIYDVVCKCKSCVPEAKVYVYDNASEDRTYEEAVRAGAIVKKEPNPGKGNVIKSMFRDIQSDIYIMIDGDMTYEIRDAVKMINLMEKEKLDMVIAARKNELLDASSIIHIFGNKIYNIAMKFMFGGNFTDIFSGFRVLSRNFVKSFNVTAEGFDIEAEMTVYSIMTNKRCREIQSKYYKRPNGSHSKLNAIKDGLKICIKMLSLFVQYRIQGENVT